LPDSQYILNIQPHFAPNWRIPYIKDPDEGIRTMQHRQTPAQETMQGQVLSEHDLDRKMPAELKLGVRWHKRY
jgi:hypothetical protein